MITRRNFTLTLAALPFAMGRAGPAHAQSYPNKPIRFVVPFPAGGSTDVGARLIAESLSRAFGQQVYVENKSGANGTIGIEDAATSAPDGYTILVTTDSVASNPYVFHTKIDPTKDLLPIIQLSRQPIVLAAHPSLGVKSLAELIVLAKRSRACHTRPEVERDRRSIWRCNGSRRSPASRSSTCLTAAAARRSTICSAAMSSLGRSGRRR